MKKLNKLAVKVLSVLLAIILLSGQNVFASGRYKTITTDTYNETGHSNYAENSGNGGVFYIDSPVTLKIIDNSKFKNNSASNYGGVISNYKGAVTIGINAEFTQNNASGAGAIANQNGNVTIGDGVSFIENNSTNYQGGAIYNSSGGTFTIKNGAKFIDNKSKISGGAISNWEGIINLIANTKDIEFTGNKTKEESNAIYSFKGTENLWAGNASIIFNDKITSYDNSSVLNINKEIDGYQASIGIGKIILNEDMSEYIGTVNFYGGTIELSENGKWFGGTGNIYISKNSTINFANDLAENHNFGTVNISGSSTRLNLPVVNADLEKEEMDTISAASFSGNGKITVNKVKIIKDKKVASEKIIIPFANSVLKNKIEFKGTVESLLYKYDVSYDAKKGCFTFANPGGGSTPVINLGTAVGAVAASVGGYATQSVVINQAFAGIDRQMTQKVQPKTVAPKATVKPSQESSVTPTDKKQPAKTNGKQNKKSANINSSNLYVSAGNQIFDDSTTIERSLWLRPFALQETIKLNGVDIDNTLYGTLAGIDLPVGQDKQLSFYLGYAGSKQEFDEVKTNQTGYLVGLTGMLVKEKWYLGVTVNGIFNKVSADSEDETNDFDMNMFTIGAKAGYNIDLSDKWILEPNITVMYGIANSDSYETSLGSIDSQSTSNILVEEQVKAKWQLANGWQPYGLIGCAVNLSGKPKVKAGGEELELDSIDGFVEYGIGVNKEFIGSVWSCYGQVTGRSGGRNGFGGNLGIKYKF